MVYVPGWEGLAEDGFGYKDCEKRWSVGAEDWLGCIVLR